MNNKFVIILKESLIKLKRNLVLNLTLLLLPMVVAILTVLIAVYKEDLMMLDRFTLVCITLFLINTVTTAVMLFFTKAGVEKLIIVSFAPMLIILGNFRYDNAFGLIFLIGCLIMYLIVAYSDLENLY